MAVKQFLAARNIEFSVRRYGVDAPNFRRRYQNLRNKARKGEFAAVSPTTQLQEALDTGVITQEQFDQITRARKLKRDVIMVDDFDMQLDKHDETLLSRHVF